MRYEKPIKSWEDWAVWTWRDIDKLEDDLKETKKALADLEKDYTKLKWQVYTVAAVVIVLVGIIEFTINK